MQWDPTCVSTLCLSDVTRYSHSIFAYYKSDRNWRWQGLGTTSSMSHESHQGRGRGLGFIRPVQALGFWKHSTVYTLQCCSIGTCGRWKWSNGLDMTFKICLMGKPEHNHLTERHLQCCFSRHSEFQFSLVQFNYTTFSFDLKRLTRSTFSFIYRVTTVWEDLNVIEI